MRRASEGRCSSASCASTAMTSESHAICFPMPWGIRFCHLRSVFTLLRLQLRCLREDELMLLGKGDDRQAVKEFIHMLADQVRA